MKKLFSNIVWALKTFLENKTGGMPNRERLAVMACVNGTCDCKIVCLDDNFNITGVIDNSKRQTEKQ